MAGRIQWEAQVDSNVAKLLSETKELRDQLDGIKKGNYEIKLNIDDKKLEKVISNLDKMLESLGKGTGDFKEFENLSKQLNEIVSEVKELNKAFGGINDSGVSNLLSSIQSIDKSLSSLSEHITNVNKDFGSVGKNASDNVGQINEARKATEGLTEATKELANAQKNVGNKSNISSGNSDPFNEMGQYKKISESTVDVLVDIGKSEDEILSKLKAEKELAEANNEIWKERLILLDSAGKVVASHRGSTDPITGINGVARLSQEELDKAKGGKIIHTHPNKASFFSPSDYKDMIMDGMSEQIKTVELMWKDSTLSVDKSSMTKQTSSTLYNIIRNVSKTLTDIYTDNPGGTPSLEAREHINAIQKEIFKVVAQKLNISVSETGEQSKAVVDALSDVDKAIIRKFKGIEASVIQDINPSEIISSIPIKDTFQGGTSEASKMEEVATATTNAVHAKKDFATANEGVQASVDNSKSKLELESELMEEVAKSADKATKAKDKYSKRSKISEDTYTRKSDDYASIANQKLNNSGYTILGESVSTELENGLVKVSAKIKNADGIWKTFSAKIDADGNMFEQRFRTVTNGIEKLENELRNFDRESTNSVNRVNKTFADIDIPKESFDDVIAKFNIIEEKAKNIVKITRSDVQNNDGTYSTSYTARYKDGSNEILGESSDPQLLRRTNVLYDAQQAVKESNKAYKELIKTIQNYSEVQKRIAKNEAFDGDLALAQKLRDEITELQKQPILSSTQLEEANKRLVKLRLQVEKIKEQTQQTTQSKVDKALVSQLSAWKSIQGIREKIAKTDKKDTTKLQKLNEEKRGYQKQYLEAEKVLKANEDLYDKESQLAKLELERLETNEKINKLKLNNVDIGSVLSKGDDDLKKFEARKNQSEEYRTNVEKLKQSIEELRILEQSMVKSKLLPDGEAQKINEAVASIEEYTNAIKNMPAVEKGSDEGSRTKLANRIHEYMDKNTRMTREFREEFENLIRVLRSGDDSVNIKDIARQFEDVKFRVKEAKQEGISFFDIFKNKVVYGGAARLAQYYLSFYDFIRYARYAVQSVIEFDTALTEMRKVSNESVSTLERLQKATFNLADGVGTTALELQKSVADFMRIGESLEDATKSAQDANVLFRVSEFDDVTQATDALVAMSAAYKDLEKSQINDVLNEIGNNYAISTDELASALQKSAATLSVAGNDIYEAAALVTAGNTVLQDADSVGTGLKMISLRILGTQEAKDELASLGENVDDFVVQTKSKIDQTVRNYTAVTSNAFKGISVLDDNGNYRSTYEILRDISRVYQEIIETDKKAGTNRGQALLEVLAGKNRSNVAASILQSPEILESAYESALNSAGSAQEELNKYLESAEAKAQELKNQLQEFWSVLLDSGTLKTIIGSLTTILEKATELVDTFGTLGTAGLGLGAFLGIKNVGINMLVAY